MLFSSFYLLAAVASTALAMGDLAFNYGINSNLGACKSEAEIELDLKLLKQDSSIIKTFALANCDTLKNVGAAAAAQLFLVIFGVQPGDDAAYAAELAAMDKYLPQFSVSIAKAFVVGSESLYRKDYTAQQLADKIDAVKLHLLGLKDKDGKSWGSVPVGTADSWNVLVDGANAPVVKACDIVFTNAFSYWQGQTMKNASYSFFDDIMQALQTVQTIKGKTDIQFWVGETGWPTKGANFGSSVPSVDNAKQYWQEAICAIRSWGINVAVFEAFDEAWKPDTKGDNGVSTGGVEQNWGVYDSQHNLKYSLKCKA